MSEVKFSMVDHSGEACRTGFYVEPITALNHDTVTGTDVPALKAAIASASLANFQNTTITHSEDPDIPSVPANSNAQREIGLEVTYVDSVTPTRKYRRVIPAPDLSQFAQENTDVVDMGDVAPANLKTALETYARSEAGNAITVIGMRIVGRRS